MVINPLTIFIILAVIGIVVIFIGFVILLLGSLKGGESKVEGGGVVIVGPIPIVIGTSERISRFLIVLAIALTVFAILLFLLTTKTVPIPR